MIPFKGYNVWYRAVGERGGTDKLPLLCLHGGPGAAHDYLEPLEAVAASGRRVIFYDQLGCGNSDRPHNPALWTVDLFLEELAAVRAALGLERLHILGQSWGGMLAMQYALTRPAGVASLVIASSPASMRQWVAEANRLRAELPADVQETLLRHERAGTTDDPAYTEAMMVFYQRHVCRLDPWPDCLNRSLEQLMRDPEVYHAMNGPSEFHVTGNLRDWDITGRLGEIAVPTLVTSGRHDEATPAIAETVHKGIPGSRRVIFEQSAHESHIEEPELYRQVLIEFLEEVEQASFKSASNCGEGNRERPHPPVGPPPAAASDGEMVLDLPP
ncbi:MAG: proline iminopeptidase-family hydrolase [bacterium]|nr:proline iminopeptidase-family hydrolase [bacterium]